MKTKEIAKMLQRSGLVISKINCTTNPQNEDDEIVLGGMYDGIHVQVGPGYACVVRENADGTFTFYPTRTRVEPLVSDMKEAIS